MSKTNIGSILLRSLKMLLIGGIRIVLATVAFILRITALVLSKLSELFEKFAGHGSGH